MLRTELRIKFLKSRKKTKTKKFHETMEPLFFSSKEKEKRENIGHNKTFWKIVKPVLSKKINSNEIITLIENNEIIKTRHSAI